MMDGCGCLQAAVRRVVPACWWDALLKLLMRAAHVSLHPWPTLSELPRPWWILGYSPFTGISRLSLEFLWPPTASFRDQLLRILELGSEIWELQQAPNDWRKSWWRSSCVSCACSMFECRMSVFLAASTGRLLLHLQLWLQSTTAGKVWATTKTMWWLLHWLLVHLLLSCPGDQGASQPWRQPCSW